jgi:membrane fusion protein (multidrug efflux system)
VDEANRRVEVARTSAGLARKKLADTVLRSPFDGVVARRLVNPGEYVRAGTPAFQVVNVAPLKFRGEVPERYVPDVKLGDPVTAVSSAVPGPSLTGRIVRIGPSVTVETRSFPIEAELENPEGAVKPGTFCRLSILTGTRVRALVVPESAVVLFAGNPRVFLARDGKAAETPIEVAGRDGDRVVVASGLSAGDPVIATGANLLVDGKAVEIRAPASPPAPPEGDAR